MTTIWQPRSLVHSLGLIFFLSGCGADSGPSKSVEVEYCDQLMAASPNDSNRKGADPLLAYQWYLDRIGVQDLWDNGYTGRGVDVSIVDDALEIAHEDLIENVVSGMSLNYLEPVFSDMRFNPMPVDCQEDGHGTAVAGIIAARGDNGVGIKGVAYEAGIYLHNYLASQLPADLRRAIGDHSDSTAVSSNSWGSGITSRLRGLNTIAPEIISVISDRLVQGFDGKGVSYVFAAGNSREISRDDQSVNADSIDMASYSEMLNYPGIMVVCAVNAENNTASYSNPGANLWICGPSGDNVMIDFKVLDNDPNFLNYFHSGLPSVDLSSEAGYNRRATKPAIGSEFTLVKLGDYLNFGWGGFELNFTLEGNNVAEKLPVLSHQDPPNSPPLTGDDSLSVYRQPGNNKYTRFFQGTSAATPVVSGVIALLRAKHPDLSWRDIMLILAESAEQVDPTDTSWQEGAAVYSGSNKSYTHSIDYGFGLIDATGAMNLAASWHLLPDLPDAKEPHSTDMAERVLDAARKEFSIEVGEIPIDFLEYVQVFIDSDYPNFGDLDIRLVSPQGIESVFTRPHKCLEWDDDLESATMTNDCPDLDGGFTFASVAHLGADPTGAWKLIIQGIQSSPPDLSWQLIFHGF